MRIQRKHGFWAVCLDEHMHEGVGREKRWRDGCEYLEKETGLGGMV